VLGDGPVLAPEQMVVLETDPSRAREIARGAMAIYLSAPNYVNNLKRHGFTDDDVAGGGSDALVDAIVAWGTVDDIRARVDAHHAAGADHVCVQVLGASLVDVPEAAWRDLGAALL
jgi:probable F420-dependent oxidoreductase